MNKAPTAGIRAHFEACARDLTPSSAGRTTRVIYAPFADSEVLSSACASILSDAESLRLKRITLPEQRAGFAQRRAFRRYCGAIAVAGPRDLSEIEFGETAKGRPYLPECPELWFSFSSCTLGMLGAWSVAHAVGVDMENQDQKVETVALANQFFTVRESDAIARLEGDVQQQTFYRLWTLKEAALKSIGEGLPFGLDRFGIDVKNTLRFACAPAEYGGPNSFCGHEIEGIPARAALVTRDRFCDSAWHSPKAGITCSGSMAANSDR